MTGRGKRRGSRLATSEAHDPVVLSEEELARFSRDGFLVVDRPVVGESYDVNDHASREEAYSWLNEELKSAHRVVRTGFADDDSEDDSFEPATWEQTEGQG